MIAYTNPVWPGYFADPFVLRHNNEYYAYGTGAPDEAGRQFPILQSSDLVHWKPQGAALIPLNNPPATAYWAPEVAENNGLFYLYYSASIGESDEFQRLRVAIADNPLGPFKDTGNLLLAEIGFSIDPSPFLDPRDGRRYLFFAADYEKDEPTGTGLQMVGLNENMISVIGKPRDVLRASARWQIYEERRNFKGRIWDTWYCLEGPNVVYHDGRYICFFSGGQWRGENYGVAFAVAEQPTGPWRCDSVADGPGVLRGIPERIIGPGHNCTVVGPDGKTLFMVYHAWDANLSARRMHIDPIRWKGGIPSVDGPSDFARQLMI